MNDCLKSIIESYDERNDIFEGSIDGNVKPWKSPLRAKSYILIAEFIGDKCPMISTWLNKMDKIDNNIIVIARKFFSTHDEFRNFIRAVKKRGIARELELCFAGRIEFIQGEEERTNEDGYEEYQNMLDHLAVYEMNIAMLRERFK